MGRTQPSRFGRVLRKSVSSAFFSGRSGKPAPHIPPAGNVIEALEQRKLFSALTITNGVLTLDGNAGSENRMLLWSKSDTQVTALVNGVEKDFNRAQFGTVAMTGGAKNDFISISNRVAKPATVDGRGGNDTINVPKGTPVSNDGDGASTPTPPPTPPTPPSSNPSGGVIASDNTAAKPKAVINVLDATLNAGQAVHVDALQSTLNAGSPITARYEWDFGDEGSDYNDLVGFNAAHVYSKPGNYTLTLRLYNEDRGLDVKTVNINVAAAGRTAIYVNNNGSDSNSGTSASAPIKTWTKAISVMNNKSNVDLLFATGQTFTALDGLILAGDNIRVSSYGSGNSPVIKYAGELNRNVVIRDDANASNVMIEGLTFDSIWNDTSGNKEGMPLTLKPNGNGFNVRNNVFLNVGYAINANGKPNGLLVQGNSAPLVTGVRDYFLWAAGTDITVLGNSVANVTREHVVRVSQATGINLTDNKFTNLSRSSIDRYDVAKGSATIQQGSYAYLEGNTFNGATGVGPLGEEDGLNNISARFRYAVYEGNRTINSTVLINHGAEHVALRNNILERNGGPAIEIDGYSPAYERGVVDLLIVGNTGINSGTAGRFLWVGGSAKGIELVDNLYKADALYTGSYGTAGVYVNESSLNSFSRIDDNIWPVPTASGWAENGVNWIGTNGALRVGYQDPTEWNAQSKVGTDAFQDTPVDSKFSPTDSSLAAVTGTAYTGLFTDFYGNLRPTSGPITVGAVET